MKRKRTRIYLSGPITGLERETVERNFKLSEECAKKVFGSECEVVSPLDNGLPYDAPYERHMRRDISTILNCDGIVMGRGCTILCKAHSWLPSAEGGSNDHIC